MKRRKNKEIKIYITNTLKDVGFYPVAALTIHCGLWQCRDKNRSQPQAFCVYLMGVFSVFGFFFFQTAAMCTVHCRNKPPITTKLCTVTRGTVDFSNNFAQYTDEISPR